MPHLFKVYVHDLSTILDKFQTGYSVTNMIHNHLIYAYYIVILSLSSGGLITLIEACQQFGLDNYIKFNSLKSAILPFLREDKKKYTTPTIQMNNQPIPIADHFKYLSHILSNNRDDDLNIDI